MRYHWYASATGVLSLAASDALPGAQPGCTPLITAGELFPEVMAAERLRTHMKSACNFTFQVHWLTGAGDTFWVNSRSETYGAYHCIKLHAWMGGFYQAVAALSEHNHDEWYVLDVGGNLGQEPIIAAMHGYTTYTFEPFPSNVAAIKFNAAMNCVHDRVIPIAKGTSNAAGFSDVKVDADINGRSFASTGVRARANRTSGLELTTLDLELKKQVIDQRKRPLLLKIDNEGNEEATFEGARNLLASRPPPVIIFETRASYMGKCMSILKEFGYAVYSVMLGDSTLSAEAAPTRQLAASYFEEFNIANTSRLSLSDIIVVHVPTFRQPRWHGILSHQRMTQLHAQVGMPASA